MESVRAEVRRLGGVARIVALRRIGVTTARVRAAIARGELRRVRKGWVCVPDAPADVVRAVSVGGRLACISAARSRGLWVPGESDILHVGLPHHAGHRPGELTGVVAHWTSARWRDEAQTIEPVDTLIRQVLLCCDRESAIAIIDSALNQRKLTGAILRRIVTSLPTRFGTVLDEVDAASESGLETLCRLRLTALGASIRSQVTIPGVGRVDLLIGDRLIVEADGREWHDGSTSFHADRTRDLALLRLGYLVIRVSYEHVINEWMLVELTVRGANRTPRAPVEHRAPSGRSGALADSEDGAPWAAPADTEARRVILRNGGAGGAAAGVAGRGRGGRAGLGTSQSGPEPLRQPRARRRGVPRRDPAAA